MASKPRVFRPAHLLSRREAAQEYEQRRGSARERGYTARWDHVSRDFRREHPLCIGCKAVGLLSPSDVVDHIVPHKGNMALFWEPDNWQPGCAWHHDVVKQRLEAMWMRGEIDTGQLLFDSDTAKRITRLLAPQ